jgi:Regulator of chromosome condensation (RCC1) repeat
MCGSNDNGQLAMKPAPSEDGHCMVSEPTRAASLEAHVVDTVTCGSNFTIAVTKQGQMIGWGGGEFGQIGAPTLVQQVQPRLIKGLTGIRIERVVAGAAHVLALSQLFQVYTFGMGLHGALGHGDEVSRRVPLRAGCMHLTLANRWSSVHTIMLPECTACPAAIHVPHQSCHLALMDMSSATCRESPTLVDTLWFAGICVIDSGDYHSVAAAVDGRVWTWGRGKYGALGHGDTDNCSKPTLVASLHTTPVVGVAAGAAHTVALSRRRRVYSWGQNRAGQLGLGHCEDGTIPVVVADSESWLIAQVRDHACAISASLAQPSRIRTWHNLGRALRRHGMCRCQQAIGTHCCGQAAARCTLVAAQTLASAAQRQLHASPCPRPFHYPMPQLGLQLHLQLRRGTTPSQSAATPPRLRTLPLCYRHATRRSPCQTFWRSRAQPTGTPRQPGRRQHECERS